LPGRYFVSRQDISNSGKHHCYNAWLIVNQDSSREEKTSEIPKFVVPCCDCLEIPQAYQ
jgi:hypothetical protein